MSRHDDRVRLQHRLAHARAAIGLVKGRARDDPDRDRTLNLALVRLLEVVGEAAARVSPATQARIPGVPWPQVVGMRNRLIHGYDDVDFTIRWEIVTVDLPPLVAAVQRHLDALPAE